MDQSNTSTLDQNPDQLAFFSEEVARGEKDLESESGQGDSQSSYSTDCRFCGKPVDERSDTTYHETTVWLKGQHKDSATLRDYTGRLAHGECVKAESIARGQVRRQATIDEANASGDVQPGGIGDVQPGGIGDAIARGLGLDGGIQIHINEGPGYPVGGRGYGFGPGAGSSGSAYPNRGMRA